MKRITAIVLAAVLATGILTLAAAGCGGGGSGDAKGPEAAAQAFVDATMDADADAVYELLSAPSQKKVEDKESLVEGIDYIKGLKVGKATMKDGKAYVETKMEIREVDQDLTFNIVVVEENGVWKISLPDTEDEMDKAAEKMSEGLMEQ